MKHTFTELLAYDGQSWSTHAHMPEACCYSAMAGLNDEVWVIGGSAPAGTNCWVYDAASGERRDGPSLPAPRMGCIGAAVDGRVYVIGGSGAATLSLCPCLAFIPSLSWQIEYPVFQTKTLSHSKKSAVFSSAGGFGADEFDSVLSIAPDETEWRTETPAPGGPLPAATLAGCELDGKIYVLGGAPARFLAYDVGSGTWDASLPPHPEGSQAAYMAAHDGAVWVACGTSDRHTTYF